MKKNDNKKNSGFNEEEFEKTSDISSMYSSIKKTIISQDEQIMQILTALFKIFAGKYSNISLIKPNDENDKPYVLTKTK